MDKCNSKPVTDKPEDDPIFEIMGQEDCPICGYLLNVLYHPIYLWGVSCDNCTFGNAISGPALDSELGAWCGTEVEDDIWSIEAWAEEDAAWLAHDLKPDWAKKQLENTDEVQS